MFLAVSEKERVVNLGELLGKLPAGSASLTGLKDDRRNKVSPGIVNSDYRSYSVVGENFTLLIAYKVSKTKIGYITIESVVAIPNLC